MDRRLAIEELAYLLDHLELSDPGSDLAEKLQYGSVSGKDLFSGNPDESGEKIIFPPSDSPLDVDNIPVIDDLPVLFPCSEEDRWYSVEKNRIRFHHDILKSAFYLLSGYQEIQDPVRDEHGRFPWRSSVQYRLGITHKPVVNYYFTVIREAVEAYCEINRQELKGKKETAPLLFLSHDVDRIVKYSIRDVGHKGLLLLGLKKSADKLSKRWKDLLVYARGTFFFKKDPYWNFEELIQLEELLDIRSTWFMLEKTRLENSRYHFSSRKIRGLIELLEGNGHEIGIHGTLESSDDPLAMKDGLKRLRAVTKQRIRGNRQHYLKYDHPLTTRILDDAGITYDATLGFAEQIGFRNSFAFPFRLYDFDQQRPFRTWHIPLTAMDVTFTGYMQTPIREIPRLIEPVLHEVRKFGGVFGLLWHNCHLDEEEFPGINRVYRELLKVIMESGFVSWCGREVIEGIRSAGASDNNS